MFHFIENTHPCSVLFEMDFHAKYAEDGNPIPDSIKISFKHPSLNRKLADYVKVKDLQNKLDDDQQKYTTQADQEAIERTNTELEMTRLTICRAPVVISKKFNDGHIRVKT